MQGKLSAEYTYLDLMDLARLKYNNAVEDETWDTNKTRIEQDGKEDNILALATQILEKVGSTQDKNPRYDGKGSIDRTEKQFQSWHLQNPTNGKVQLIRRIIMNRCDEDLHLQRMWCGRKN